MNSTERKISAQPGRLSLVTARFIRLNYFRETSGYTNARPNILLINTGKGWQKLHEGEVLDAGENTGIRAQFNYFGRMFVETVLRPDFEVEFSDTPLTDLRHGNPHFFWDRGAGSLNNNSSTGLLDAPPNYTAPDAVEGLEVNPVFRRFRLDNTSGGTLLLRRGVTLLATIPTGTTFDQPMRGPVEIRNQSGGALSYEYQWIFECI